MWPIALDAQPVAVCHEGATVNIWYSWSATANATYFPSARRTTRGNVQPTVVPAEWVQSHTITAIHGNNSHSTDAKNIRYPSTTGIVNPRDSRMTLTSELVAVEVEAFQMAEVSQSFRKFSCAVQHGAQPIFRWSILPHQHHGGDWDRRTYL